MAGFFDFLGFGSHRRSALQVLDRTLANLEVNPAYIDDGMRYAIYKWALEEERQTQVPIDRLMQDAAALMSYCVLGDAETETMWGPIMRDARRARFDKVLANDEDETFDARLIKLVLAKDIAAPDIHARVSLES